MVQNDDDHKPEPKLGGFTRPALVAVYAGLVLPLAGSLESGAFLPNGDGISRAPTR